ncbi:MAG: DUF2461 domain-containing protein [Acidobacteriota bacterium]|nr:MAG: DUF2461 domain-containing protein [Acidobacteriota bacterium]
MEKSLKFLAKLKKNNDRDWFNANKKEYEAAREEFTGLVEKLIAGVAACDPDVIGTAPKDCLFRIYRDVRFSADKSPYKTAFGAYIAPGGRKSMNPGYYIHIEPKASFVAGGMHRPEAKDLLAVRNVIAADPKALEKIEKSAAFRKYFDKIDSHEKLKTAPKGFEKDHPAIDYLKLKGYTVSHEFKKDSEVKDPKFAVNAVRVFKAMNPLIEFLRSAAGK